MAYNPLLLIDFYKATHKEQYPEGLTKMVSYYTPRMNRIPGADKITLFGLQAFIKEYLIKGFNDNFFNRPEDEVVAEYDRVLLHTLGPGSYESDKVRALHKLGYLPIEISAIPEGSRTGMGCPQIEITNTHPDFVWLVNTLETMMSCSMWHTQVSAEVGYRYRHIVDPWVEKTCDDGVNPRKMLGDFSMRGQHSVESAIKSSGAWCLSFDNTATVPAILWLEDNYNCDCTKEPVAYGAISTEHSVMCSNKAVDGDEITQIKRLLTEIYPNNSFSMVSDSYDYWNLVDNILPQCRKEIMEHNGTILIRGDSGNPVEILAGKYIYTFVDDAEYNDFLNNFNEYISDFGFDKGFDENKTLYFGYKGKYYRVELSMDFGCERGNWSDSNYTFINDYYGTCEEIEPNSELLGTVWALDQQFGHTVNSKGYKVLDSHVKAIYGDSILPDYVDEIYRRLAVQGYACSNVVLGVGSMSMMAYVGCNEEATKLVFSGNGFGPYTRDTYGIAVKATYAEDKNGDPIMIYKQPKALSWKKSQKGCCIVHEDGSWEDQKTFAEAKADVENILTPVFRDGKMVKEYTLKEIRERMYSKE